jgi:hypothetical protein
MDSKQLYHWGIPGMKWGVRKYQNKDGSLTDLGKRRYNRDADEKGYDLTSSRGSRYKIIGQGKDQRNERLNADPQRYVKEDRERTRSLLNDTAGLTRNIDTMVQRSIKNNPVQKMDLSNMTDQEMRNQINRAMLERQYNDLFAPRNSTRGREYVGEILKTTGEVLAVTTSAISIALSIQQLRGKAP